MIQKIIDICFNKLTIEPPKNSNNNSYLFPVSYDENSQEDFTFSSSNLYSIDIQDNLCKLHIKELNELKFFNKLHKYLLEILYEQHEKWFETKFEKKKYLSMFKEYLHPNIEKNSVNVMCHVSKEVIDKTINNSCDVYPTFRLRGIIFDNINFQIDLELVDVLIKQNTNDEYKLQNQTTLDNNEKNGIDENEEVDENAEVNENIEEDENVEEDEDIRKSQTVKTSIKDIDTIEEFVPEINHNVEEIQLNIDNDDEKNDLELENNNQDRDFYIIFKIIHSNIKENMSQSLLHILEEKGIETKKIDIQNIVYDSDENSEDEYLENEDDFENELKNMI